MGNFFNPYQAVTYEEMRRDIEVELNRIHITTPSEFSLSYWEVQHRVNLPQNRVEAIAKRLADEFDLKLRVHEIDQPEECMVTVSFTKRTKVNKLETTSTL